MPQSLIQMYAHLIFSTKHRVPHLADLDLAAEVHAYLAGTCRNLKSPSIIVGGAADHVHLLCYLSSGITVKDLIRELKLESSKWIKTRDATLRKFYWQSGYGAFSVSPAHVDPLKQYIREQEEHHKKESFQEEFLRLLKEYGTPYDERYIWD